MRSDWGVRETEIIPLLSSKVTPFTLGVVMNENEDTADLNRGFKGGLHYIRLDKSLINMK